MTNKRFDYRPFSQTIYDRQTGEFYQGNNKTEKILNELDNKTNKNTGESYTETQQLKQRLTEKDQLLQKQLQVSQNLEKQLTMKEKEITHIKTILEDMIANERTQLGKNTLKQYQEAIQ